MEKLIKTLYITYIVYCIFYFIIADSGVLFTHKTELQALNVFNFLIGGISIVVLTFGYGILLLYIFYTKGKDSGFL